MMIARLRRSSRPTRVPYTRASTRARCTSKSCQEISFADARKFCGRRRQRPNRAARRPCTGRRRHPQGSSGARAWTRVSTALNSRGRRRRAPRYFRIATHSAILWSYSRVLSSRRRDDPRDRAGRQRRPTHDACSPEKTEAEPRRRRGQNRGRFQITEPRRAADRLRRMAVGDVEQIQEQARS
jgi:hypothetical protein